jgi:hypothetical protein
MLLGLIGLIIGEVLWIYNLIKHYKTLKKQHINVKKNLIWGDIVLVTYPILAIIVGSEDIFWEASFLLNFVLTIVLLLATIILILIIKKKYAIIFIKQLDHDN